MMELERIGVLTLEPNPQRRRDLRPQSHVQLPVDRTYYIGAKTSPVRFRIMDKMTDQKNPAKQTRVELEQDECSARIEATLEKQPGEFGGPAAIGLITVEDLIGFRFQELRKMLFDFWLLTVSAGQGKRAGKPDAKELEVFRRTGVFGLERYQRAAFDRHEEMRELGLVRGRLPEMGEKGYRVAFGKTGTGGGMNKRVEQALAHLSGRWSRETLRMAMPTVRDLRASPAP